LVEKALENGEIPAFYLDLQVAKASDEEVLENGGDFLPGP
jgi:hypothetical protein